MDGRARQPGPLSLSRTRAKPSNTASKAAAQWPVLAANGRNPGLRWSKPEYLHGNIARSLRCFPSRRSRTPQERRASEKELFGVGSASRISLVPIWSAAARWWVPSESPMRVCRPNPFLEMAHIVSHRGGSNRSGAAPPHPAARAGGARRRPSIQPLAMAAVKRLLEIMPRRQPGEEEG